jgi:hypothetical protein
MPLQAANSTDDDWLDYNNELRIGILEAYSGILQGLGPGRCFESFATWGAARATACYQADELLNTAGCPYLLCCVTCCVPCDSKPYMAMGSRLHSRLLTSACCCVVLCCPTGKAEHYLRGDVPAIILFANSIAADEDLDDTVVRNCVNLLGDVCTVIPNVGDAFQPNNSAGCEKLFMYCRDSGHLLGDCQWAIDAVNTAVHGS